MTYKHRIHRYLEARCSKHVKQQMAPCASQRPGYLARLMFRFVYNPLEFRLRKCLQADLATLNRRKIAFFDTD